MDFGWRFFLGDSPQAADSQFNDSDWRSVNVPHDWSIEGPFDQSAPVGFNGGYLPTGVGWYRKHFTLPESVQDRHIWIEFDGVYMNSEVWINGHYLGKYPNGYMGFSYDLTSHLRDGENLLSVRVDNSQQPNTRWYSGSGIYRDVWLVIAHRIHIQKWGVTVTTPHVAKDSAAVSVKVKMENFVPADVSEVTLRNTLIDSDGLEVAEMANKVEFFQGKPVEVVQLLAVQRPILWSIETPVLYTLRSVVLHDEQPVDEVLTEVGIREIRYEAQRGFFLNGRPVKMNGVNLHHDGGAVGAAVPERVWQRRLGMLKEMGCNAIRTAHNPPAPEFLQLCDRLGFLVMDEAFDEWRVGKREHAYNKYFDEWGKHDLAAMIRRDRNHPSVVLWSIGNEIREQPKAGGHLLLKELTELCQQEDPTRPTTVGCDNIAADDNPATMEFLDGLDIVGYNYVDRWHERRELYYSVDKLAHPGWLMIGTESVSNRGDRGGYSLGDDPNTVKPDYNFRMIRAEQLWKFVSSRDYVIGDFMWTGIDYLGESFWPSVNSGAGVLDLCGFPKDGFYFYQSQWTDEPMLHLFPHWSWPGREGQVIPVLCYTNCDAVELYLNGKSFGEKRLEFPRQGNSGSWNGYDRPQVFPTTADLHLAWDVPYTPGTLKAVGKRNGEIVLTQSLTTTGAPASIRLKADRKTILADHRDVVHLVVEIIDADGNIVPTADNRVFFKVDGPGRLIGVSNGNRRDHDFFRSDNRRAYNGLCLAILQSMDEAGELRVAVISDGLQGDSAVVVVTEPERKYMKL
jgi:beta-galactosidase